MRLILIGALALAAAAPASAATRSFTVTGFDRVRLSAPYAVTLSVGPPGTAKAEGTPDDLDRVRMEVRERVLVISIDRSDNDWRKSNGQVRVAVSTPVLTAAVINGAGSLTIDRAKAQRFELTISGAGNASIGALQADRLVATLIGAGVLTLGGKADQARIVVQGAGNVEAKALATQDAEVIVSGAGNLTLTASRTAKVTSSGVGNVAITGGATCQVQQSGMGEVICGQK